MQNYLSTVRSNRGFTLTEMLLVIIVIGTLAAIAVPTWLTFVEVHRLNTAKDQVSLAMREAQSKATHEKLNWQASFREVDQVVQWAVHPASVTPASANWHNLDSHVRLDTETNLESSNGVRQIKFDYRGNVSKPPLGRITLSSKYGGKVKRCVIVSTILGAMRTAKEHSQPKEGNYCY